MIYCGVVTDCYSVGYEEALVEAIRLVLEPPVRHGLEVGIACPSYLGSF